MRKLQVCLCSDGLECHSCTLKLYSVHGGLNILHRIVFAMSYCPILLSFGTTKT